MKQSVQVVLRMLDDDGKKLIQMVQQRVDGLTGKEWN